VTLFERVGKSMVLTTSGLGLLEHARVMGSAAEELALAATGRSEAIEGVVAISASDAVAAFLLPSAIRHIHELAPKIVVEVVTSNALSDLRRREADIAIRHVSPTEPDLIARHLREATASFYASTAWVARHGHPRTVEDALAHPFIGADRNGRFLEYLHAHGLPLTAANFRVHSESSVTGWALVRDGHGIGVMMDDVADATPGVLRVLDDVPPVRFPIWLVTHRELRTARRIRVVFDILAESFGRGGSVVGREGSSVAR
jgi:DNA-binding transcriptional LysR family regulator